MGVSESSSKIMEQIAHMDIVGVSHAQIATTLGVDESRISQVCALETYAQIKQQIVTEKSQYNRDINDKWDNLEKVALNNVTEAMKYNKDPDFNLRVASVANRAARKGGTGQPSINNVPGMRVAISLPITFVNMIRENGGMLMTKKPGDQTGQLSQKFDILKPHEVEETLGNMGTGMFADIDFSQKDPE